VDDIWMQRDIAPLSPNTARRAFRFENLAEQIFRSADRHSRLSRF
jgi:hypothetical protein